MAGEEQIISESAADEIEKAMRKQMNDSMWIAIDSETVVREIKDGPNGDYEIYCGIRLIED